MAGALRIEGCTRALIDALAASLDADHVLPSCAVTQLSDNGAHITASLASAAGEQEIELENGIDPLQPGPRQGAEQVVVDDYAT